MSYLREYIRHCFEEGTQAFGEYPLSYDPETVLCESEELKTGFEDLVNENMELAYFSKSHENQVGGAAWICDDGKIFEFAVVTSEDTPDYVFESLVRDCMEEYGTLSSGNRNLTLEVKVEDDETERHLFENYGLSVLRQDEKIAIMGFGV